MAGFVLRGFKGMRPILDPRLLGPMESQEAKDVRLFSGNIAPVKDNDTVVALKSDSTVQTIYRVRDNADETLNWFEFDSDVDVALSPITQDEYGRSYWTGDGAPKYAPETVAFQSGSTQYPRNSFTLGVPKPETEPVAIGTSVEEPTRVDRTYVITNTNSDGSKESGISQSITVKSLNDNFDHGLVITSSFTAESESLYAVECSEPHNLEPGDFIAISGSTVTGWNDGWEVDSVQTSKSFKIKNTQTFPGSDPSGSFTVKKRYLPTVKLFSLPTTFTDSDITHRNIYRKVSGTYRLVTKQSITESEYTDSLSDSEMSGAAAISSAVLKRPGRPATAPIALVPFDDTTLADNEEAESPATVYDRLYAISYVSDTDVEGPLSASSGVIKAIDGSTSVRINHVEDVSSDIVKKRIYRQNISYSAGTYTVNETNYRLVAEVPLSQDVYIDTMAQSSISGNDSPAVPDGFDKVNSAFGANATLPPQVITDSRVYVYTYVSEYGEEGPPSDPSTLIDIDPGLPVVVTMGTAPTGSYNITKKYIYRTSTGTNTTSYQFVAEVPVATTTYSDYKKASDLGEVIPSVNWQPPPSDMVGLRVMANGIFTGFSGKDVCFSEPFLPHAWATVNRLTVDHNIVGLGAFGQSLAVLTDSFPYIITGVDPSAMTMIKTSLQQACVSKRSIVETGDGVIYASPDGLVKISLGGIAVITEQILSQEQWQSYNPSSIHAYMHEGRYYAFYTKADASTGVLVFTLTGIDAPMSIGAQHTTAAHVVPTADSLYIVEDDSIKKMDKGNSVKEYLWKSKVYESPMPMNYGVAQIFANSYGSGITFKVFADGSLRHTKTVTSSDPFRLPSGFLAKDWYVQVEGTSEISCISVAQSPVELRSV